MGAARQGCYLARVAARRGAAKRGQTHTIWFSWLESEFMHFDPAPVASLPDDDKRPWYKTLTRYHWFVLFVAALGWLFDCLDQQIFVLARPAAMKSLVPDQGSPQLTDDAAPSLR